MEKPTENGIYYTTVEMAKKLSLLDLSKEEFVKKVVSITTPRPMNYGMVIKVNKGIIPPNPMMIPDLEMGPNRWCPMKCLSVSQPFANLIVQGKKTIELRRWNTNFRGEFLIHSPQKIRIDDCKRLKINQKSLIRGAIIGKAEIYYVKKYKTKTELNQDSKKHLSKKFQNNKYGFCLKNAKAFRIPVPAKGQLGFFEIKLKLAKIKKSQIITDLIDEEYRYQWIGRH